MSLWDFVGGASRQLLSDRKEEMARKLKEEEEAKRERARIVATVPDYDTGKIKEVLAGGETRELPMPESMQMEGIRKRVMEQRGQLIEDADRERQGERQKAADERAMKQLEIQERNASGAAAERGLAAKAREEEAALRRFLAGVTKNEKGEFERDPNFTPPIGKRDIADVSRDLNSLEKQARESLGKGLAGMVQDIPPQVSNQLSAARRALAENDILAAKAAMDSVRSMLNAPSRIGEQPAGPGIGMFPNPSKE